MLPAHPRDPAFTTNPPFNKQTEKGENMKRIIERITSTAMLAVAFMLCASDAWGEVKKLNSSGSELLAFWPQFSTETSLSGSYELKNLVPSTLSDGVITISTTGLNFENVTDETTWNGNGRGITVMLRYSGFTASGNKTFIATFLQDISESGIGVYGNASGNAKGIWSGNVWGSDIGTSSAIPVSGTMFFEYDYAKVNKEGNGTYVYNVADDGTDSTIYYATSLYSDKKVGKRVNVGSIYNSGANNSLVNSGLKVESVAIFYRTLTAAQRKDIAKTRKIEVTASSNFSDLMPKTLGGANSDWNTGTNLCINVPSTAAATVTLSLPADGIDAGDVLHIQVAEGKTLVLQAGTATAANIIVTGKGIVQLAAASTLSGTIKGDGIIKYAAKPTGITLTDAAWTGTFQVAWDPGSNRFLFDDFGNSESTVELIGSNGSFNGFPCTAWSDGSAPNITPAIKLSCNWAISAGGGWHNTTTTIPKLSGTGNFTIGNPTNARTYKISKIENYTGTISNGANSPIKIGNIVFAGTPGYDDCLVKVAADFTGDFSETQVNGVSKSVSVYTKVATGLKGIYLTTPAKVGGQEYNSLAYAIAAADAGETKEVIVTLRCSESVSIPAGVTVKSATSAADFCGTITGGSGVLIYEQAPSVAPIISDSFSGSVWLKFNYNNYDIYKYGSASSTIILDTFSGYLHDGAGASGQTGSIPSTVEIAGTVHINNSWTLGASDYSAWNNIKITTIDRLTIDDGASLKFAHTSGNTAWGDSKGVYRILTFDGDSAGSLEIGNGFLVRIDSVDFAVAPSGSECIVPIAITIGTQETVGNLEKKIGLIAGSSGELNSIIQVKVNGVANGSYLIYKEADGDTVQTSGLYLFVEPVAKIDETEYMTLQEAINGAGDDPEDPTTITLLYGNVDNVTLSGQCIVLDNNGHAFGGTFAGNGTIVLPSDCISNWQSGCFPVGWTGTVVLQAKEYSAKTSLKLSNMSSANGTLVIKGITRTGTTSLYLGDGKSQSIKGTIQLDGDLVVSDGNGSQTYTWNKITGSGNFTGTNDGGSASGITHAITTLDDYSGTLSASGVKLTIGTVNVSSINPATSTLVVKLADGCNLTTAPGNISVTVAGAASGYKLYKNASDGNLHVMVRAKIVETDTTETPYYTIDSALTAYADKLYTDSTAKLVLIDGEISSENMTALNNMGYYFDGVDTIFKAAAKIGTIGYASLADAITAASEDTENPSTITILSNNAEDISLGKAIIFAEGSGATFAGTFTGNGTLSLVSTLKSAGTALWAEGWTGTVALPANQSFAGLVFDNYGRSGSTVRLQGTNTGWLQYRSNNDPIATTVEIPDGASLTITGWSPSFANAFDVLKGSGTFAVSIASAPDTSGSSSHTAYFLLKDVSNFTGSLSASGAGIAIGDTRIASSVSGGKIIVSSEKFATIASGATWQTASGFSVDGALTCDKGGVIYGTGAAGMLALGGSGVITNKCEGATSQCFNAGAITVSDSLKVVMVGKYSNFGTWTLTGTASLGFDPGTDNDISLDSIITSAPKTSTIHIYGNGTNKVVENYADGTKLAAIHVHNGGTFQVSTQASDNDRLKWEDPGNVGGITVDAGGEMILKSRESYTRNTILNGGTITLDGIQSSRSIDIFKGPTFTVNDDSTIAATGANHWIYLRSANPTFNVAANKTLTVDASFSYAGDSKQTLVKTGAGTMVVNGYSGDASFSQPKGVDIQAGTYELNAVQTSNGQTGDNANFYTVAAGAKLKVGATGKVNTATLTLNNGSLLEFGANNAILINADTVTFTSGEVVVSLSDGVAPANGTKLISWATAPAGGAFTLTGYPLYHVVSESDGLYLMKKPGTIFSVY